MKTRVTVFSVVVLLSSFLPTVARGEKTDASSKTVETKRQESRVGRTKSQFRTGGDAPWVKHPICTRFAKPKDRQRLEKSVAKVMALSDKQIRALITEKIGYWEIPCPNCRGKKQRGKLNIWDIDHPDQIKCALCGMVFPNDRYPADKVEKVTNLLNEVQEYRYYKAPNGRKSHIDCARRAACRDYLMDRTLELAQLYLLTKDARYAHKTAVIIDRYAQVYPHYPIHGSWARLEFYHKKPRQPFWAGRWSQAWMWAEVSEWLITSYDFIYNSGQLEKLSKELGVDVKKRIERDLFAGMVGYLQSQNWTKMLHNAAPDTINAVVLVGRVIGRPDYVHEALGMLDAILHKRLFSDGMWYEGVPGYHGYAVTYGMRKCMKASAGYSDPPGYVGADGRVFRNLDLATEYPMLYRALHVTERMRYPDGTMAPLGDTSWARVLPKETLERSKCELLTGLGYGILGRGKGTNQFQAHLQFASGSGGSGHVHADQMGITIFAKGQALLADIGYSHSMLRPWSTTTVGHNTIVVDEVQQKIKPGRLELWRVKEPRALVVQASAPQAYPGKAGTYRRLLAAIPVSGAETYLADVFWVQGGRIHDWCAHGHPQKPHKIVTNLQLKSRPGTMLGPDTRREDTPFPADGFEDWNLAGRKGNGAYQLIDKLRRAGTSKTFHADFRYPATPAVGLRLTMLGGQEMEVIVGQAPAVRPPKGAKMDNRAIAELRMPMLMVRRQIQKDKALTSRFAAVWQPYQSKPFLKSVQPLQLEGAGNLAAGFRIDCGKRVDLVLIGGSTDAERKVVRQDKMKLRFKGGFGLISLTDGKASYLYLLDGTELTIGDVGIEINGELSGNVEAVNQKQNKDYLLVSCSLPEGKWLEGENLLLTFGDGSTRGITIDHVEAASGKSRIWVKEYPGLKIDKAKNGVKHLCYPGTFIKGEVTFRIAPAAVLQRKGPGLYQIRANREIKARLPDVGAGTIVAVILPSGRKTSIKADRQSCLVIGEELLKYGQVTIEKR